MKKSDFFYNLPKKLIAQKPRAKRDASRLLVIDRKTGKILKDTIFRDISSSFREGDLLVRNITKVIPARIFGEKETGVKTELLLSKRLFHKDGEILFEAIASPGRRLHKGDYVFFPKKENALISAKIIDRKDEIFTFHFLSNEKDFQNFIQDYGEIPLPKYIEEKNNDPSRYQTIYASSGSSAAAPTAGLHFTEKIFSELREKGVEILDIQLDISWGTFAPVWEENIEEHKMHTEFFHIEEQVAKAINQAKKEGRRIIALGTTSLRALESASNEDGELSFGDFETDIFIKPGYQFKLVDGLITNFHLPESTLLMLVSAFLSREKILDIYRYAVDNEFRFFSFGDAMFIL